MMTESNIFSFAWLRPKSGGANFGGARLPHELGMTNNAYDLCRRVMLQRRVDRRAVGTRVRPLFRLDLFAQLGNSSLQTSHTLSRPLGARFNFDQMQGQHSSRASGRTNCRSGASPHQSSAGPLRLMTNIETFVPYFKHPIVSL